MNKPFLYTFIAGTVLIMFFALYKTVMADESSIASTFLVPDQVTVFAQPISNNVAYQYFKAYHQSDSAEDSKGVLETNGKPIIQFYVDQEQLIEPLKAKANALGKEFLGMSA